MKRLLRFLKLADILSKHNDIEGLNRLCIQFDGFIKKHAHFAPMMGPGDYDFNKETENLPWSGSTTEFLKKFPGGIPQWKEARKQLKNKSFEYKNEVMHTKNTYKKASRSNLLHRNMDYSNWENSPYFGSISEFIKKFPGGIKDWVKWRRKTEQWNIKKKVAERIKNAKKNRKAIYSAVFLLPESKEDLADWWEETQGEILPKEFMHHMTIKFKPSPEDVLSLPLGKSVRLQIIGVGSDEKGQAVAVNSDLLVDNPIPHITVATNGTSPVYSNELLSKEMVSINNSPPVLLGIVGIFDGENPKFDLKGTIYEDMKESTKQDKESEESED